MKTYEEMTRDVLKRRDNEINIRRKRRKNMLRIGIPSMAVVVGIAGITLVRYKLNRGGYVHLAVADTDTSFSEEIMTEIPDVTVESIRPAHIVFNDGSPDTVSYDIGLDPRDFEEYTLEGINNYYGLKIDVFSDEYPEWTMEYDKLGIYRREGVDEERGVAWCEAPYWQQNLICWRLGEKEVNIEVNEDTLPVHCVVFEGNDDEVSVINNVDVWLYHSAGEYPNGDPIDTYNARFMFGGCGFEITACGGVTEDEFVKIVELYTNSEKIVIQRGEPIPIDE